MFLDREGHSKLLAQLCRVKVPGTGGQDPFAAASLLTGENNMSWWCICNLHYCLLFTLVALCPRVPGGEAVHAWWPCWHPEADGRVQRVVPMPCVWGQPWGNTTIRNRWDELRQHGLGLMCCFSSVCLHLFGKKQFLPWLGLLPRKLLYCILSCHFICSLVLWGDRWQTCLLLPFDSKVFLYCVCFVCGCGIIGLRGPELWAEVLPCLVYQVLLLKQPGCPHLIPSLYTVSFAAVCFTLKSWTQ